MSPAPIALFVYNRPEHTRRTVEALRKNELASESDLIIFSDGPKSDSRRPKPDNRLNQVRNYIHTIEGFKSIRTVKQETNLGLANSIISGVTQIVNEYGRIIVLEDDMVTSPFFLRYMNEALDLYADDDEVISIHGYVYPIPDLPETFFIKGADCWGWATWKRDWDLFEEDGNKLLQQLKEKRLLRRFDFDGTYPYIRMLEDQAKGRNDSWAIRWYASALLKSKLTLYPGKAMVENIGLDSTGTHNDSTNVFDVRLNETPVTVASIPLEEDAIVYQRFKEFYRKLKYSILRNRFRKLLSWVFGRKK